ncbi:MAG: hypothetical protein LBR39_06320, partial [Coriobacteriales bacterium]|nr:hypothetical protein [Coriobacteriales bacterium]
MKATQYRLDWRAATLSSLLALVLSLAFLPLTALADDVYIEVTTPDVPVISSTTTIDTGGTYQLDAALTGADITINTSDPVTIIGNGGAIEAVGTNNNIAIIGWTNGVDLTLQDVAIIDNNYNKSVLNFTGGTNYLYFSGTNLLEIEQGGGGTQAMVHVPEAANLTVGGTGTLYFYKSSQGAGFGSDKGEKNGDMTFNNVTIFGKSTKPGPAIGSGAAYSGAPGNITFNSGEYTIIANAMGACIGGGSGGGGGTLANPGGNVYVKGGTLSINVDWAGAAIGGGGYAGGNDAIGGNLYVTGGSIRTVCDENALSNWASAGVTQYGVTDKVVTANKLDADGEPVRMLVFDTSLLEASASYFEVQIDGNDFYNGTLHHYKFINEEKNKDSGEYEPITVTSTNWVALEDSNLYFYISPAEHSLIVNGEEFTATWDAEADSFTVASAQSEQADPTDGLKAVYLNGASGNDANDGIEAATAVKTFSAAKALLSPTYAGATIYITGIVTVTADETWSLAGYNQARVQRASTFTGSSKYFI